MRSGPLSDDLVIETINENFIPVEINVTRDGFPIQHIPALQHYQKAYQTNWRFEFGFANCSVVDVTGQIPLGIARPRGQNLQKWNLDDLFQASVYMEFILTSLERHRRLQTARSQLFSLNFIGAGMEIQALVQEIIREIQGEAMAIHQFQQQLNSPNSGLSEVCQRYNN